MKSTNVNNITIPVAQSATWLATSVKAGGAAYQPKGKVNKSASSQSSSSSSASAANRSQERRGGRQEGGGGRGRQSTLENMDHALRQFGDEEAVNRHREGRRPREVYADRPILPVAVRDWFVPNGTGYLIAGPGVPEELAPYMPDGLYGDPEVYGTCVQAAIEACIDTARHTRFQAEWAELVRITQAQEAPAAVRRAPQAPIYLAALHAPAIPEPEGKREQGASAASSASSSSSSSSSSAAAPAAGGPAPPGVPNPGVGLEEHMLRLPRESCAAYTRARLITKFLHVAEGFRRIVRQTEAKEARRVQVEAAEAQAAQAPVPAAQGRAVDTCMTPREIHNEFNGVYTKSRHRVSDFSYIRCVELMLLPALTGAVKPVRQVLPLEFFGSSMYANQFVEKSELDSYLSAGNTRLFVLTLEQPSPVFDKYYKHETEPGHSLFNKCVLSTGRNLRSTLCDTTGAESYECRGVHYKVRYEHQSEANGFVIQMLTFERVVANVVELSNVANTIVSYKSSEPIPILEPVLNSVGLNGPRYPVEKSGPCLTVIADTLVTSFTDLTKNVSDTERMRSLNNKYSALCVTHGIKPEVSAEALPATLSEVMRRVQLVYPSVAPAMNFVENKATPFFYWKLLLGASGLAILASTGLSLKRRLEAWRASRVEAEKLPTAAFGPRSVITLVALLAAGALWYSSKDPVNPFHVTPCNITEPIRDYCAANNTLRPLDLTSRIVQTFGFTPPHRCESCVVAYQGPFRLGALRWHYPRKCEHNELVALRNRHAFELTEDKSLWEDPVFLNHVERNFEIEQLQLANVYHWLETYKGAHKIKYLEAFEYLSDNAWKKADPRGKGFLKFESYSKENADPRLIIGRTHDFVVSVAPMTVSFNALVKKNWDVDNKITYASGLNALQLGDWYETAVAAACGGSFTCGIKCDGSRFDATLGSGAIELEIRTILACFKQLLAARNPAAIRARDCLLQTYTNKVVTKHFVAKTKYRRKSGDHHTSSCNSFLNGMMISFALESVVPDVRYRMIVLGDDNLTFLSRQLSEEQFLAVTRVLVRFGIKAKFEAFNSDTEVSFCSGFFVKSLVDGQVRTIWSGRPFRTLTRALLLKDNCGQPDWAAYRSTLTSLRFSFSHCPIVYPVLLKLGATYGFGDKSDKFVQFEPANGRPCAETYDFYLRKYGWSKTECDQWKEKVENANLPAVFGGGDVELGVATDLAMLNSTTTTTKKIGLLAICLATNIGCIAPHFVGQFVKLSPRVRLFTKFALPIVSAPICEEIIKRHFVSPLLFGFVEWIENDVLPGRANLPERLLFRTCLHTCLSLLPWPFAEAAHAFWNLSACIASFPVLPQAFMQGVDPPNETLVSSAKDVGFNDMVTSLCVTTPQFLKNLWEMVVGSRPTRTF